MCPCLQLPLRRPWLSILATGLKKGRLSTQCGHHGVRCIYSGERRLLTQRRLSRCSRPNGSNCPDLSPRYCDCDLLIRNSTARASFYFMVRPSHRRQVSTGFQALTLSISKLTQLPCYRSHVHDRVIRYLYLGKGGATIRRRLR